MIHPRIKDDDHDTISAVLDGKELRSWHYVSETSRRIKMAMAHEFADGWFQAAEWYQKRKDAA